MLDYEMLKVIWWLFVGVLLVGFAIMDGHDMGVGTLLPFVGKGDDERRVVINTVGPHWDGNQVWFITGGGAIFAAWPLVYATAFSGFYWAMAAVLWSMFFRPVGFDYRSKIDNSVWRSAWDWGLFVGATVPPLIFGVAFGNLLQGVPFYFDNDLRSFYIGSFWALLNPFALLTGLVSTSMIVMHGANFLLIRTEGDVYKRSQNASILFGLLTLATFAAAGLWVAFSIKGFVLTGGDLPNALPNPMGKTVVAQAGAWLHNYSVYPLTMIVPALGFAGVLLSIVFAKANKPVMAFVSSAVSMLGIIGTAGVSMFQFIMPSSTDPRSSLTVWDSVSSHMTLELMFFATLILLPLVVFYTSWAYRVMSGKVTLDFVERNDHSTY